MGSDKMTHWSHPKHPLEMVNPQNMYTCDGCKVDGMGERYRCIQCDFDLHPDCMFTCPEKTIQGHKCLFYQTPRQGVNCNRVGCTECRSCDLCAMAIKGFVYHCPETDYDFHPTCAKLKNEISIEDVTYFLTKQGPSTCAWCNRKQLKDRCYKKVLGWSYISNKDDGYSFHVHCVMEMAMPSSSSNKACTGGNMSSVVMQGIELPRKTKSKEISKSRKWLRILEICIGTVFSILLGDPTTLVASTMIHLVAGAFDGLLNS